MSDRDTFISGDDNRYRVTGTYSSASREEGAVFGSPIETNPVIGSEGQRWVGGSRAVLWVVLGWWWWWGSSRLVGRLGHASHPEISVLEGLLLFYLFFNHTPFLSSQAPSSFPSPPVQPPLFYPLPPSTNLQTHHFWLLQPPYLSCGAGNVK